MTDDLDATERCCFAFLEMAKELQAKGYDEDDIQSGLMGAALQRSIDETPHETAQWLRQIAAQVEASRGKAQ